MRKLSLAVVAIALVAAPGAAAAKPITISVLSGRADLVSGGDALVAIGGVPSARGLTVMVAGRNQSRAFAKRSDGRVTGLIRRLRNGRNTVLARAGTRAAKLVVTNHPIGGPVLSGPQLQPWVCQKSARDKQCNQPTTYDYLYKSTGGGNLKAYDPSSPPDDVATTTTDSGVTVPFIVRREMGY